jgi:hypothetical protein
MPARRDREGRWRYRKIVKLPDGQQIRISGTPTLNTKLAAEAAERDHINRVVSPPAAIEDKEGGAHLSEVRGRGLVANVPQLGQQPAEHGARRRRSIFGFT